MVRTVYFFIISEPLLSPYHPSFIGCWWLGSVVIGILLCAIALPMFCFPKHFPSYYIYHKQKSIKKLKQEISIWREVKGQLRSGVGSSSCLPSTMMLKAVSQFWGSSISIPRSYILKSSAVSLLTFGKPARRTSRFSWRTAKILHGIKSFPLRELWT